MVSIIEKIVMKLGALFKFGDKKNSPNQKINIKSVKGNVEAKNINANQNEGTARKKR